jgi:hypothetical protein
MSTSSASYEGKKMDTKRMEQAVMRTEPWDVARRLDQFGITRDQLLEVVRACVSGAGNVTENDPPGSHGWEIYRFGVRRFREVLRPEGWWLDNTEGLATIVNEQLKIRIAVANTDDDTGVPDPNRFPTNRNKKGPTADKAVEANVAFLPGVKWPLVGKPESPTPVCELITWHLCIHINGDDVRAELSLMDKIESGFFSGCKERIIILKPGDWTSVDLTSADDDQGPELDIDVRPR